MYRLFLAAVLCAAMAFPSLSLGQCPGGQCQAPQTWQLPSQMPVMPSQPQGQWRSQQPTRAFRYIERTAHYKSVVRVATRDRDGKQSYGSGVAVKYNKWVVILTARHVIRDAAKVFVFGKTKYVPCAIVKTDGVWDVALLQPEDESEFDVAEIAWAETGHPNRGDRIESVGFGGDGRLATNSGSFMGYRRATFSDKATDWLVLSGRARQGDSGGPVFNSRGEVIGVLWGTNDSEVVATQCGRLHVLLKQAYPKPRVVVKQKTVVRATELSIGGGKLLPSLCPRKPDPTPAPAPSPDPEISRRLDQLIINTTPRDTAPPAVEPEKPEASGASTVVVLLCIAGAIVVGAVLFYVVGKN